MRLNETRLNRDTASATFVELFPGRGVGGGGGYLGTCGREVAADPLTCQL